MIKRRLLQLAAILGRVVVTVAVAAAAGAVAVYLTAASGPISCVPQPSAIAPEPIPRWMIAAGSPALIAALVGAYFALGAGSVRWRLVGVLLAAAVAAGTFYGVYTLLPVACRP